LNTLQFEINLTSIKEYHEKREFLFETKLKFIDKEFEANYLAISPKYGDWC